MNDTNPDLLAAVDALTKPDVLTRFTGTDHDHDWLELWRSTTPEERLAMREFNASRPRAERRPIPKSVKTGELWCPWCEVTVSERPGAVIPEQIDRHDDAPLLDQLEQLIRGSLGDNRAKGAQSGGSPINLSAYGLWQSIDSTVRGWMADLGARPGKSITLAQLLRSWYTLRLAGTHPVGEDEQFRSKVALWETAVRDILDPPTQIPYMGQACPLCGQTSAPGTDGDGDAVALWAFLRPTYRMEGSYGLCKACGEVLARDNDPLRLRQKMNGTINGKPAFAIHSTETPTTK